MGWVASIPSADEAYHDPEPGEKTKFEKITDAFFDVLQQVALGGAFFIVLWLFVISPNQVKGRSMDPTFHDKEYIMTDKLSFKLRDPKRGEVVILESPANKDVEYIKRIIGLPGDRLLFHNGQVDLNGQKLDESYLNVTTPLYPGWFAKENETIIVPNDNYFVMGDNRPGSSDSREFGFVPRSHLIGLVVFRYFPFNRAGLITTPGYNQ